MQRRGLPRLVVAAVFTGALFPLASIASGCSSPDPTGTGGGSSGGTGTGGRAPDAGPQPVTVTLHPSATPLPGESACTVVEVTNISIPDAHHVELCAPVAYATNPPSGGPHWPVWTAQGKYSSPVPRELYTHNLEHGWIVLSYRCAEGCPSTVAALEKALGDASDTYCIAQGDDTPRVILTPDPLLKTPIAVSAWGATYTATCIDPPSIAAFIAARIGRGTEMICGGGQAPETVTALCLSSGVDGGSDGGGDAGSDGG
ncbi:MAG: DUF3105 domain-containing protein [Byssovorax sp.]